MTTKFNIRIIIPSQGRPLTVAEKTLAYLPDAEICVPESQVADYERYCLPEKIIAHPDSIQGIGPKRKWIMENCPAECVVMVDDDLNKLYALTGLRSRSIKDVTMVSHVLRNTALCAQLAGAFVFGFNHGDIRKFQPQKPFTLCSWGGGIFGYFEKSGLKFDPFLRSRGEDIDFFVQSLMKHRFVWIDSRFVWMFQQWKTPGGNSANRNTLRQKEEVEYLQKKWGKYIGVMETKTAQRIVLKIAR